MEVIGERLKRRREELGLSLEQAAEATKFPPEIIVAVEEGRVGYLLRQGLPHCLHPSLCQAPQAGRG